MIHGQARRTRCQFTSMSIRESRNPRALPSGHLEAGESVVAALIREAKEEIGIVIDEHALEFSHVMQNSSSAAGWPSSSLSVWPG